VYDSYRPQNLAHCRDYIDFLIKDTLNQGEKGATVNNTPQHILDYLSKDIKT